MSILKEKQSLTFAFQLNKERSKTPYVSNIDLMLK